MAQHVGEGNFWLPSEFLTDDELLIGFKTDRRLNESRHGYVNSFGFSLGLSSPSESVYGSAETESDEDDYVTELAQKLAYAALGDSSLSIENTKGWKLSGSPQSTLCSNVTGCGCMLGMSPVSHVSVPPDGANAAAWHSLLAAVERGSSMRVIEETAAFCSGNPAFSRSRKPYNTDLSQGSGFYPNQSRVSYQQLQAAQFQQLKQQQQAGSYREEQEKIANQQMVRNVKNGGSGDQSLSVESRLGIQPCQPQRQRSSGTKAVFLGENETKSKRTGTGVFLPRNLGATPVETRKKKVGCPVLLPDRVMQALNFNLKSVDLQSLTIRSDFLEAAAFKHGNRVSMAEQWRTLRPVPPARMNQEPKLPQEWTY